MKARVFFGAGRYRGEQTLNPAQRQEAAGLEVACDRRRLSHSIDRRIRYFSDLINVFTPYTCMLRFVLQ